ncbi:ABC transporter ATP-binding protein [Sutterella sp.]|uniref:ABC transporter ATP-binding protein n=1 Tax=Sutterella sp. TaxID=1981025 RepID=UPI0026E00C22|nr:ABC transporter ATP-binding protein [Sutterella sp.]MDO5531771.1 ABC transporter ATP-binding protein [Sutterella sp.]
MIELRNVTKKYPTKIGAHVVLNDVNLAIKEGKNLGILGLNGAGKSTLIRIIGGAEAPTSGEVIRTSRVSWPIGFSGCFHGALTGRENLRFVSRIYGADIRTVSDYVDDFAELGEYMDMPVKTYSSGMRSKLAFGLSMAIGFDFYLIDEAYSVGDATFRKKADAALKERTKSATLIFVSHSMTAVRQNCTCGAVLHHGELQYYPEIEDAIKHYTDICNGKQ